MWIYIYIYDRGIIAQHINCRFFKGSTDYTQLLDRFYRRANHSFYDARRAAARLYSRHSLPADTHVSLGSPSNRYRVASMNLHREKVGPLIGHLAITIVELSAAAAWIPCRHVNIHPVPRSVCSPRSVKMRVPREYRPLEKSVSRAHSCIINGKYTYKSRFISAWRYRICCPLALSTSSCSSSSEWAHVDQVMYLNSSFRSYVM